jgi:deoxyribodipyrimidine photolyase-related protein
MPSTKTTRPIRNLILVLGDQLSPELSSLKAATPENDLVLMVEVSEEASYVRHHQKKIAFLFSAMRHFAAELEALGWRVDYRRLDTKDNRGSFTGEIERAVALYRPKKIIVTEPGEWRVREAMGGWAMAFKTPVDILDDDRFICSLAEFQAWAKDRKQLRMEYFYRDIRRKTGLLMDGADPVGGKWNFDADNRKPAKATLFMAAPRQSKPDAITRDVIALVGSRFGNHFGTLEPFWFAVTRADAEAAFENFVATALPSFGDYQDAMVAGQSFLYHAVVSMYLNCGLLDPLTMCRRVEVAYRAGHVPLNAAEGFIRQIIGWREYVRGFYWLKMPGYVEENHFGHTRALPDLYWTAETDMRCMAEAITQTRDEAYAHHIQRLMVTGNFALLAGIDPKALHRWYLTVYADAFEWVELPNTLGMSQFADGGVLASKPYAASGAYINRMSDYCGACRYDVKQRTGPKACPFNALYWDFLARNRTTLVKNPRMAQMYRVYDKLGPDEHKAITKSAATFLDTLTSTSEWS